MRHCAESNLAGGLERAHPDLDVEQDFFVNYGFVPTAVHALMHLRTVTPAQLVDPDELAPARARSTRPSASAPGPTDTGLLESMHGEEVARVAGCHAARGYTWARTDFRRPGEHPEAAKRSWGGSARPRAVAWSVSPPTPHPRPLPQRERGKGSRELGQETCLGGEEFANHLADA